MPFRQRPVEGHLHDRLYWHAKLKAPGRVNWRFNMDDHALKPVEDVRCPASTGHGCSAY